MRGSFDYILGVGLGVVFGLLIVGLVLSLRLDEKPPTCYEASLLSQSVKTMSDGTVMGLAEAGEMQFRICFKELEVTTNE